MTHATTSDILEIIKERNANLGKPSVPGPAKSVPSVPTKGGATPAVPTPAAPAVVSDADLATFIATNLPVLVEAVRKVIKDHGPAGILTLIQTVSAMVRDGLPQAQGADARAIVIAVFKVTVKTYAVPLLPVYARSFAPALIDLAVNALETIYQAVIKHRP